MLNTVSKVLEGHSVLLLGSDAAMRDHEASMLRDLGAAEVVEVETPGAALLALDGVLFAVVEAEAGGLDLLRSIRSNPATADLRVVLISNQITGEMVHAGKAAGLNGIQIRPFDISDLAETLEDAFED